MIKVNCVQNGKELISIKDSYIEKYLLNEPQDETSLLNHLSDQVLHADDLLEVKIANFEQEVNRLFNEKDIKIDLTVNFVKTTGKESFGMPYTRGETIFWPSETYRVTLEMIIHELFHIISRKSPSFKTELYEKFLGFVKLDTELLIGKIPGIVINPDCPEYDYGLLQEDETLAVGCFFNQSTLSSRQCFIFKDERVVRETTLHDLPYFQQNHLFTDYITQPEEICAEYFRCLFLNKDDFHEDDLTNFDTFLDILKKNMLT